MQVENVVANYFYLMHFTLAIFPHHFTVICLYCRFLFVIGTYLNEATAVFAVMEVGNILFGLASGSLSVISHRIKSSWFFYKELALAFSVQVFFGRFGSATSFLIIGALVDRIGLQPCLWIAFGLLLLNCGICIVLAVLDARGPAIITAAPPGSRTKVLWNFVKSLDGVFWCFTLMVFLYYGTVGAFTANGPNFIAVSIVQMQSLWDASPARKENCKASHVITRQPWVHHRLFERRCFRHGVDYSGTNPWNSATGGPSLFVSQEKLWLDYCPPVRRSGLCASFAAGRLARHRLNSTSSQCFQSTVVQHSLFAKKIVLELLRVRNTKLCMCLTPPFRFDSTQNIRKI